MSAFDDLRAAVVLLTRLPVGSRPIPLTSSGAAWFPVVGALVGAIAGLVGWIASLVLPPTPAAVLAIATATLLTGALHEDALADTADGLGVHGDRARRLEVMRDSRVGTFGALALGIGLLLSASLVAPLAADGARLVAALACAHALSRWAMLPHLRWMPRAREDGLGRGAGVGTVGLALATVATVLGAVLLVGPGAGVAAVLVAATLSAVGCPLVLHSFGGATGDTFGAVAKLAELGALAALLAAR